MPFLQSVRFSGRSTRKLRLETLEQRRLLAVVTSAADSGPGTLRDALAGTDTLITFDVAAMGTSTITLNSQLIVDRTVVIDGNDGVGGRVEVSGNNATRVFYVSDSNPIPDKFVSLSNLTISHGMVSTAGSGILNGELLSVSDSEISGNTSGSAGGGIANYGEATLSTVDVLNNSAGSGGGGLVNYDTATLVSSIVSGNTAATGGGVDNFADFGSQDSLFSSNVASGDGGAIRNRALATLDTDTLQGNVALSDGGAVFNEARLIADHLAASNNVANGYGGGIDTDGYANVSYSTIDANQAGLGGGGASNKGTIDFFQVTISGNSAGENKFGGGVLSDDEQSVTSIDLSTITNNEGKGGGLAVVAMASVTLQRSILAGNFASEQTPSDLYNPASPIQPNYTLIGIDTDTSILPGGVGNIIGSGTPIDAELSPLAFNGGVNLNSKTHLLMPTSPARDTVAAAWMPIPVNDQRGPGFPRLQGSDVDMGSVEMPDCDFDDNGDYSHDDANALSRQIARGSYRVEFDLNADGILSEADLDAWLFDAGIQNLGTPYAKADFNLDGVVDGQDFIIWNKHRFTANANFSDGNANADSVIDGNDFIVWNQLRFTGGPGTVISGAPHSITIAMREQLVDAVIAESPPALASENAVARESWQLDELADGSWRL